MGPAKRNGNKPELSVRPSQIRGRRRVAERRKAERRESWSEAYIDPVEGKRREHFPAPRLVTSPDVRPQPLRLLVADDQLLVRAGICALLRGLPDVAIIAQANDGREALRLIVRHDPDLVLMDIAMPGMNGLEALVLAKKQFPRVKIIVLSEHASEEFVFRALRAGADGFVLKDDPMTELFAAIKSVAEGSKHLSPQVTKEVVLGYLTNQAGTDPAKQLTPRQREVLKQIAEGKSTKEIATRLNVSVNTVKTHRLKLMEKLGVHEITAVVRYAAKLGLIDK